jgi:hypothetical protein
MARKKQARRSGPVSVDRADRSPPAIVVVMTVVMMARDIDARHVVMAMVVMVARPRMIVTAMIPVLNLRHHPGRTLLNRSGDTRRERGCGLRLRRRSRDNEQSTDREQAEKFFDEHQCSPSGGV